MNTDQTNILTSLGVQLLHLNQGILFHGLKLVNEQILGRYYKNISIKYSKLIIAHSGYFVCFIWPLNIVPAMGLFIFVVHLECKFTAENIGKVK